LHFLYMIRENLRTKTKIAKNLECENLM
jgi:hypothetical protein